MLSVVLTTALARPLACEKLLADSLVVLHNRAKHLW